MVSPNPGYTPGIGIYTVPAASRGGNTATRSRSSASTNGTLSFDPPTALWASVRFPHRPRWAGPVRFGSPASVRIPARRDPLVGVLAIDLADLFELCFFHELTQVTRVEVGVVPYGAPAFERCGFGPLPGALQTGVIVLRELLLDRVRWRMTEPPGIRHGSGRCAAPLPASRSSPLPRVFEGKGRASRPV